MGVEGGWGCCAESIPSLMSATRVLCNLVAHGCKAHTGLLPSFVYITFGRVLQGPPLPSFFLLSVLNLMELGAFEK